MWEDPKQTSGGSARLRGRLVLQVFVQHRWQGLAEHRVDRGIPEDVVDDRRGFVADVEHRLVERRHIQLTQAAGQQFYNTSSVTS